MYKELPLVTFEYPDSETDYLRPRYVRVVSKDSSHVKGYEFSTVFPAATDRGTFKSYLTAKIATNGVHLIQYTPSVAVLD